MAKEIKLVPILASLGLLFSTIVICLFSFRHDAILAFLGSTRFVKLTGVNPVASVLYFVGMICYGATRVPHKRFANTASCTIFLISTVVQIILFSVLQSKSASILYLCLSGLGVASSLICALYQSPSTLFTLCTKAVPLITAGNFILQFAVLTKNDIVLLIANACMMSIIFFVVSSPPLATLALGNLMIYLDSAGNKISSAALSMATVEASMTVVLVAMETMKYIDIHREIIKDIKQKQQRGVANSYATMD